MNMIITQKSLFPDLVRDESSRVNNDKQLSLFDLLKPSAKTRKIRELNPNPLEWYPKHMKHGRKPIKADLHSVYCGCEIYVGNTKKRQIAIRIDGRWWLARIDWCDSQLIALNWHIDQAHDFISQCLADTVEQMEEAYDSGMLSEGEVFTFDSHNEDEEVIEFDGLKLRVTAHGVELA